MAIVERYPTLVELNSSGNYPLHLACRYCDYDTVILTLIELFPMALQVLNSSGNYPLHLACRCCDYDTVILKLVELFPMALQKQNLKGCYPLTVAFKRRRSKSVMMKLINTFPSAFPNACKINDDVVQDKYDDHYYDNYREIFGLIIPGSTFEDIFKELVERHPKLVQQLDNYGGYPLHKACRCLEINTEHENLILRLIELFPMTLEIQDDDGYYPLHIAIFNERSETVLMNLIRTFPNAASIRLPKYDPFLKCDFYGCALHMACRFLPGQENVIRKLIELNPMVLQQTDSNEACHYSKYPVHYAISSGISSELIRYMLEADPLSVQRQTGTGDTPLHMICRQYPCVPMVEYILGHSNVKVNMRNLDGQTPLHIACGNREDEIVEKLLQHPDVDVNARDTSDETPLYKSSMAISLSVIQRLLDHPFILINEKNNNNNQTPLDLMKQKLTAFKEEPGIIVGDREHLVPIVIKLFEEIIKLLEEFPMKRRWQAFRYFWNFVIP